MEAEDRISEVEDRMVEINESERKKEKRIKRNEDNLKDLQEKYYNKCMVCFNHSIGNYMNTSVINII